MEKKAKEFYIESEKIIRSNVDMAVNSEADDVSKRATIY